MLLSMMTDKPMLYFLAQVASNRNQKKCPRKHSQGISLRAWQALVHHNRESYTMLTPWDPCVNPAAKPYMDAIYLRPYQIEALQAIAAAEARGVKRPLIALPTGTGKTVIFADLISQREGRSLVLAHRDELIEQAVAKLR